MNDTVLSLLEQGGVRPTANRILVLKAIIDSQNPQSMMELESRLGTLDKSSIFRALSILLEHNVIHSIEDGRGIAKYELSHGLGHSNIDELHPHFYCEECRNVICFDNIAIPRVDVPEGFDTHTVNYMIKGICPDCKNK